MGCNNQCWGQILILIHPGVQTLREHVNLCFSLMTLLLLVATTSAFSLDEANFSSPSEFLSDVKEYLPEIFLQNVTPVNVTFQGLSYGPLATIYTYSLITSCGNGIAQVYTIRGQDVAIKYQFTCLSENITHLAINLLKKLLPFGLINGKILLDVIGAKISAEAFPGTKLCQEVIKVPWEGYCIPPPIYPPSSNPRLYEMKGTFELRVVDKKVISMELEGSSICRNSLPPSNLFQQRPTGSLVHITSEICGQLFQNLVDLISLNESEYLLNVVFSVDSIRESLGPIGGLEGGSSVICSTPWLNVSVDLDLNKYGQINKITFSCLIKRELTEKYLDEQKDLRKLAKDLLKGCYLSFLRSFSKEAHNEEFSSFLQGLCQKGEGKYMGQVYAVNETSWDVPGAINAALKLVLEKGSRPEFLSSEAFLKIENPAMPKRSIISVGGFLYFNKLPKVRLQKAPHPPTSELLKKATSKLSSMLSSRYHVNGTYIQYFPRKGYLVPICVVNATSKYCCLSVQVDPSNGNFLHISYAFREPVVKVEKVEKASWNYLPLALIPLWIGIGVGIGLGISRKRL